MVALVSISRRKGGRRTSFRRTFGLVTCLLHLAFLFSLLIVKFLKALNVVGLVPICRCKGGRFMSFRGAFGLVHFSSSLHLLLKAVDVIGLVPISHCKGGACL